MQWQVYKTNNPSKPYSSDGPVNNLDQIVHIDKKVDKYDSHNDRKCLQRTWNRIYSDSTYYEMFRNGCTQTSSPLHTN